LNLVLVTDRFSPLALAKLKTQRNLETVLSSDPANDEWSRATALITRTKTIVDKILLDRAPNLKVIVTATSGFDHLDVDEALKRGIRVYFTPEGNVHSATEMTWALVLACARKLPQAFKMIDRGEWNREHLRGHELFGKTYGVIGLGRIGSRVAQIAKSFGMDVIAFDPYISDERFTELGIERIGMKELLRSVDFVSLHVPLTKETNHFINWKTLELMSDDAWLINTSRGPVVSEQELVKALEEKLIAGVGLDVFEQEPLSVKSSLRRRENVVLLPHCGGNTHEAFERSSLTAAQRVIEALSDSNSVAGNVSNEPWFQAQQAGQGFRLSLD
jgi:D-3-phosphoglycerate dehydrogenase / 2-oxoglutarate reductase